MFIWAYHYPAPRRLNTFVQIHQQKPQTQKTRPNCNNSTRNNTEPTNPTQLPKPTHKQTRPTQQPQQKHKNQPNCNTHNNHTTEHTDPTPKHNCGIVAVVSVFVCFNVLDFCNLVVFLVVAVGFVFPFEGGSVLDVFGVFLVEMWNVLDFFWFVPLEILNVLSCGHVFTGNWECP
jgi:hypothetical protein